MFHFHPSLSNYHFPNLMFLPEPHLPAIYRASQLPSPQAAHTGTLGQLPTKSIDEGEWTGQS